MDDDNADWFSGADEAEAEPQPAAAAGGAAAAAPAAAADVGGAETAAGEGGEAPAGAEEKREEAADEEFLDPDKLLLFKHWIRPRFLQYKYIYDYRQSYYDDVIEVVNRRRKGYKRDIPRPQTWAERTLRTYNNPLYKLETFDRFLEDVKLVTRSEISGKMYRHNIISKFNKRYSNFLY